MAWQTPTDFVNETTGLFEGIADWAYGVTFGTFWTILLLGFCIVLIMATRDRFGTDRAMGFAGVTGLFGSLFLVTLGLMPWWIASIFIMSGIFGIVYMIMNK